MNVNQKIWLGFGSVLALVGVGSTLSYLNSHDAERVSTRLAQEYFAAQRAAKSADEEISLARIHELRFIEQKDEAAVARLKTCVQNIKTHMTTVQTVAQ